MRFLAPENRWRHLVERDLAPYWNDYRLLGETSVVACVFHTIQIGTQIFLAWALGLKVPAPFFFIFVPVVNILGMLPVSFSGIGIREGGYWFFLAQLGVDRAAALALGLLSRLRLNLSALRVTTLRTEVSWDDFDLLAFFKKEGFSPARRLCLDCALDPTRVE